MLQVKELTKEYLDSILEIENEAFANPWKKENFEYELNDNPFAYWFILVNKDNNEILGFMGFWIKFEFAEIVKIAIKKSYRGHKLANILMEDLIKRVTLASCENISLEVRVSNQVAINLYHKYGFENKAIRKKYYQNNEDAILMVKEL